MLSAKLRKKVRANPVDRRGQILDEAVRIIGERGFYGFTIQELSQRCGLTNAGLLYYFGSKDKLLIALLNNRDTRDAQFVRSIERLRYHAPPAKLPFKAMLDMFHVLVERNSTQPELVRMTTVLRSEALDQDHPAYDYFLQRDATALDAYTEAVSSHVKEPRSTARQLLALMTGLEEQWLRADQDFDLVAEWDKAIAAMLPRPVSPAPRSPSAKSRSRRKSKA